MRNTIDHPTRGKLACRIWDNGGETADRYTVIFKARRHRGRLYWPYLASGDAPFHPQGFGQHGEFTSREQAKGGKHLGKRVPFEAVPQDVQRFILQSI